jgi:hypothetical protein
MNQQPPDQWQELARIWKTGDALVTVAEIEELHGRQTRRLRIARMAELGCSLLGVIASLWLGLASPFLWVGIVTAAFSVSSVYFVWRAQRMPLPQGSADLLVSLKDSLAYLGWLAEQLRYGRILGFVALFAVVMAASTQLMRLAAAAPSGLLATSVAGMAISATLAWNMRLAWQVWRRTTHMHIFRAKLLSERESP